MKFGPYKAWKEEWKEIEGRGRVLPMLVTYGPIAAVITLGIWVFAFGNTQQNGYINHFRRVSVYEMSRAGSYNHYYQPEALWSSSYRLTLNGSGRAVLEGWTAILNRSNHDWVNVRISVFSEEVWHDFTGPLSLKRDSVIRLPFLKAEVPVTTLNGFGESNAPRAVEIINTTGEALDAGTVKVWESYGSDVFSLPITRAGKDMFFGTINAGNKFMLVLAPRKKGDA